MKKIRNYYTDISFRSLRVYNFPRKQCLREKRIWNEEWTAFVKLRQSHGVKNGGKFSGASICECKWKEHYGAWLPFY